MSTAILEPPVTEVVKTTPAAPVAPTAEQKAATVASLLRPSVIKDGVLQTPKAPEPLKEVAKEEVKAKETPVAEVKKEPEVKAPTDAEKNFAALREKAEAAEKRALEHEARIKAITEEYETLKKQPVPAEFSEKLTKAEQRAQELQQKLVAYDITQEPEFQKISTGIQEAVQELAGYVVESGVPVAEVNAAIARWDEGQLFEWKEAMTPGQRLRFEEAFSTAIRLDRERTKKLQNPQATMEQMQKARQAEQEAARKSRSEKMRAEAKSVLDELLEKKHISEDDQDLKKEVSELLFRSVDGGEEKLSVREVFRTIAQGHVLGRHFQRVEKQRSELAEKLAAAEKTLAERDEFIKSLNGSEPSINPTNTTKASDKPSDGFINSLLRPVVKTG